VRTPKSTTLCVAFSERGSELIRSLGLERITLELLDDLTLLTLGPQLRGGNNTKIGRLANEALFELIHTLVKHAVVQETPTRISLKNAAERKVTIAFSADPDISIVEGLSAKSRRNVVAVEIKGGGDQSNIWNRLGEAEKSHQSAKQNDFTEFWTIYNVPQLDLKKAHEKSPTTNRFYNLRELLVPASKDFMDFQERLTSLLSITVGPA